MRNQDAHIEIDIARQQLLLRDNTGATLARYRVATAVNGPGESEGSFCTPRGDHIIRAKIGAGCDDNTVFVGRRPTGEYYSAERARATPGRDWILARILWLSGTEPGRNRLGPVDTMRRYVYIHGTADAVPMGRPSSHGCIRMRRADVVDLFERVCVGTRVTLHE
jgi:lipoprotein-anchoring transpeptidase ErfK/SrfK